MIKTNLVSLTLILIIGLSIKPAFCESGVDFKQKLKTLKWVAYAPSDFNPLKNHYPSEDSIREDLALLREYGFEGIVTYGSNRILGEIPRIAREEGFKGVIMGIWSIDNREETMNAVAAAKYVDGYCVGNEGLNSSYNLDSLTQAMSEMKESTGKPVATTEQIYDYSDDSILALGDWVFPNIHPFLSGVKDPKEAVAWIEKKYKSLQNRCPEGRIILIKEAGVPTAGADKATESNQKDFFDILEKTDMFFVYFEAFDQNWKRHLPVEPYWGLFDDQRKPKKYISSKVK